MVADGPFTFRGINHVALVCSDMARTVDFYQGVLGMPLVKTVELPAGMGQHFFFDCGNGDTVAFFWFPEAPEPDPGVASAPALPDRGSLVTATGSMNHLAFQVSADDIEAYAEKLEATGVETTRVANHDDSEWTVSEELHAGVYIRSLYFFDPDGILLEFAAWTRELSADDVAHLPQTHTGQPA